VAAFDELNRPFLVAYNVRVDQRQAVRAYEDGEARGWRARLAEVNENSGPDQERRHAIERRGDHAHDLAWERADRQRGEQAFDRLNPDFGVPADHTNPLGQRATQEREMGLALGTRTAVAITRENEPNPLVRVVGQDDRVAAAVRTARLARARQGPERTAPER